MNYGILELNSFSVGFNSGTGFNGGEVIPIVNGSVSEQPVLVEGGETPVEMGISDQLFTDLGPNTQAIINGTNVLSNGMYLYRIDGAQVITASGKCLEGNFDSSTIFSYKHEFLAAISCLTLYNSSYFQKKTLTIYVHHT